MALYRNIAGFVDNGDAIGLTLLQYPIATLPAGGLPINFGDPEAWAEQQEKIAAERRAQNNSKYDWIMSHTTYEIAAAGYYVMENNGSLFQWTDAEHTTSRAWLPIQDIQEIENERGTAGALLMHMREPILAKDTAGYGGGGSASGGSTTQYSDPIPEVKEIPDPQLPDGAIPFEPTTNIPIPTGNGQTTPTNNTPTATQATDWLPLLAVGGVLFTIFRGEKVFKKKRKLVLIGGLGAMYYLFSRKE